MNVWTGGTFDLLHAGHVDLFKECRRLAGSRGPGGRVIVAVNTDEFVERFKGQRPIQPLHDRLEMAGAMRWVDGVQANDGSNQAGLIVEADAGLVVVGDDWAPPRDYLSQLGIDQAFLDRFHINVVFTPRIGVSTSQLKSRIQSRV